jgi:putative transposase
MVEITTNEDGRTAEEFIPPLDELAREGARRMIAAALKFEADEYVERFGQQRDDLGRCAVVRNGKARERTLLVGSGPVRIQAPRVRDRRDGEKYTSRILPPYMRRSPKLEEVLPVLYLRGLSTGDFKEALPVLLGEDAAGLSAPTISRLLKGWQGEYADWRKRSLAGTDYVYVWADGVYFRVRLEEDRLACLVLMGVRADGTKEVIALEAGYRESEESWASLLRDVKRRGMSAPVVAVGDGALGFWAALRQVYPETHEQRCWVHKIANVLDKLPKRLQAAAKSQLHEIMQAPDRKSATKELLRFVEEYGSRYPKATECLSKDQEVLLTFYDFPAYHWQSLRTTNPIESGFATVKHRTRKTKGFGSRKAGLAFAFKLILAAGQRWRRINAPHLLSLVRAGITFKDGLQAQSLQATDHPARETVDSTLIEVAA